MRKATNIQWSTNDSHALEYLPNEIEIPVGMEEDAISDYLSEQTGYLHEGYVLEQDMKEKHRVFIDMDGTLYAFHDDILDDEGAVQIEKMYEKDGILYVVMGQGDDGDYMKDGKLAEALYRSEDGVNFSFVEEIADDTPEQAG